MALVGVGPTSAANALPFDVLPIILDYLTDRRDLCTCAQLSKAFHHAVTPLLYRTLDVRVVTKSRHPTSALRVGLRLKVLTECLTLLNSQQPLIVHPATTILKKPEYAKYVRHIREAGSVRVYRPDLWEASRKALRLCVNLEGFTWSDDSSDLVGEQDLMAYLDALQQLPIRELVMRTFYGLSDQIWERLQAFTELKKVSIWCMEGKPRILQGWSEKLGPTLTHLELGRCSGVPASILISVLSQLPQLRVLRLKGAPSSAILEILTFLPLLETLDTEYFGPAGLGFSRYDDVPAASLRELTVRTSSVHVQGPHQLWTWILRVAPRPSLVSFTLNAFSSQGEALVPRGFILDMAATHKDTLRHFTADSTQMTMKDLECLCTMFPMLETLSCSTLWTPEGARYDQVAERADNLRELKINLNNWMQSRKNKAFAESDGVRDSVRRAMLRQDSVLRVIGIGCVVYQGRWVHKKTEDGSAAVDFEIVSNVVEDLSD